MQGFSKKIHEISSLFFMFRFRRIRHFAGSVQYSINGFLEKNSEFLPRNVSTCLYQSKLPVVQSLFPEGTVFWFFVHRTWPTDTSVFTYRQPETAIAKTYQHRIITSNPITNTPFNGWYAQNQLRVLPQTEWAQTKQCTRNGIGTTSGSVYELNAFGGTVAFGPLLSHQSQ